VCVTGAVDMIVKGMRRLAQDVDVQFWASNTLAALCEIPEHAAVVFSAGGCHDTRGCGERSEGVN
jgi:hypothetical protein